MATADTDTDQFTEDPRGWARRWQTELAAARKKLDPWHAQGDAIDKRFRDDREASETNETRLNLFTSGIETKQAILYGQPPKADVSRRFADASDDEARVASEILERLINTDIERSDDTCALALHYALEDRLLPGFGLCRVRYVTGEPVAEPAQPAKVDPTGLELAPAVPEVERRPDEQCEVDYVHWKDILWSPARVWHEVRWLAFRAEMSRKALVKRFGEEIGSGAPLNANKKRDESKPATPWDRAEVWEIWDKESERVYFYIDGHPATLDVVDDPLGLDGFWPCPRPMVAGATTSGLVPRPDYVVAQDLYKSIDQLSTRIALLRDAIRVTGVYNKTSDEVKRLLEPGEKGTNKLYPVENWAMFAEKGGVKGQIDWLPLDQIVAALTTLRDIRSAEIEDVYQLTGMSDIMRGQASSAGVTATEQGIKAKFGSVRMQRMQDEFARFASDLLRLKAEVIAKHFDASTILERCNCQHTADDELAPKAVDLIKSDFSKYRIEVKPESVSLTDFAALKQERTEVIGSVSMFLTAAAPLAQAVPGSMPFLLQLLQTSVAGLRGSSAMEAVLDQAIAAAEQQQAQAAANPQQQAPDPKVVAQQMKGQADLAKVDAELKADITRTQVEVQADAEREQNQAMWNTKEHAAKQQITNAFRPKEQPMSNGRKPGGL